jgi:XTP/dITP diphosphohydrolase
MKLYLATSNKGKVKEIKELFSHFEVIVYSDVIDAFEVEENGETFKANAMLKSQAVYEALNDPEAIVIADDSGISIEAFDGAPGIFSARYAGEDASSEDNLQKVIATLKEKKLKSSPAFYTAAIAITTQYGTHVVHGWMHGDVIDEKRGDGGFGYDPIFIPEGFNETLGELSTEIKSKLSHRSQALSLLNQLIKGMKLNSLSF